MGLLGWELVAVTPHPGDSPDDPCFFYRLKRLRQQAPQAKPNSHEVQKPVPQSPDEDNDMPGAFAFGSGFYRGSG
jgi:hypothetical protein